MFWPYDPEAIHFLNFFFFFCPVKVGRWLVITSRVGQEALTMTILSWTCISQDLSKEQDFFSSISHLSLPLTPISHYPWNEQFSFLKWNDILNERQGETCILFLCPQSAHCSRWFYKTLVFSSVCFSPRCQLVGCLETEKRYSYLSVSKFSQSNQTNLLWGAHWHVPWRCFTKTHITLHCGFGTFCAFPGASGEMQAPQEIRTCHLSWTLRQGELAAWGACASSFLKEWA